MGTDGAKDPDVVRRLTLAVKNAPDDDARRVAEDMLRRFFAAPGDDTSPEVLTYLDGLEGADS